MKKIIHYRIACPLAAVIVLPAVASAQEGFSDIEKLPQQAAGFVDETNAEISIRDTERALRREIEEIEAASARRRAVLEQRLAESMRQRELEEQAMTVAPQMTSYSFSSLPAEPQWLIGIQVAADSTTEVGVEHVVPDMPAARSGIQRGDKIEAVNGIKVGDRKALNAIINAAGSQELTLRLRRSDQRKEVKVTPTRPSVPTPSSSVAPAPFAYGGTDARGFFYPRPEINKPVPAPPVTVERQWLDVNPAPSPFRSRGGGPDTAEIQSLKNEMRELREIVKQLADTLSESDVESVEVEFAADEAAVSEDDEEDDLDASPSGAGEAVETFDAKRN